VGPDKLAPLPSAPMPAGATQLPPATADDGVTAACRPPLLRLNPEQPRGGVPQHCRAVGIAEPWGVEDVIDRSAGPGKRIVRPHDDLAGTDLRHQVPQGLRREDDGIEIELPQIFS